PHVVIGCLDPNPKVAGNGVRILRDAGISVELAADPTPFQAVNQAFFVNQLEKRAFISLKWAESADGMMAKRNGSAMGYGPVSITGPAANLYSHHLRAKHHAIMVGTNTALIDDPSLTVRHVPGEDPIRIIFDRNQRLSGQAFFSDQVKSILLGPKRTDLANHVHTFEPSGWQDVRLISEELFAACGISSILVEGGSHLLQQFIDQGVWDRIYRYKSPKSIGEGLSSPQLTQTEPYDSCAIGQDWLFEYRQS
ncbi:MAG: dihydrofolate reductase family protein, partial [Bacteroidota bacterium]